MKEYVFLINFEKDDHADIMIDEEDELILDETRVLNLLREEGLSLDGLNGSAAIIQNFKKQLYIKLDSNNTVYTLSLLNLIELPKFIEMANTFLHPKKVILSEVSPQIGGYIDRNYGIKFKINIIEQQAECIYKEETKKANQKQANIYIRSILDISSDNDEYNSSIEDVISKMRKFFLEGIGQTKHIEHQKNSDIFNIFYSKEDIYYFASYKDGYYAAVRVEDIFLVYFLSDNDVRIICHAQSENLLNSAVKSYFTDLENAI